MNLRNFHYLYWNNGNQSRPDLTELGTVSTVLFKICAIRSEVVNALKWPSRYRNKKYLQHSTTYSWPLRRVRNRFLHMTKISMSDRNNAFHTKPSAIKKAQIKSEPSGCLLTGVIAEFSTRGFSVLCSDDILNTGPWEVVVFVWVLRSVMDRRDKDY